MRILFSVSFKFSGASIGRPNHFCLDMDILRRQPLPHQSTGSQNAPRTVSSSLKLGSGMVSDGISWRSQQIHTNHSCPVLTRTSQVPLGPRAEGLIARTAAPVEGTQNVELSPRRQRASDRCDSAEEMEEDLEDSSSTLNIPSVFVELTGPGASDWELDDRPCILEP